MPFSPLSNTASKLKKCASVLDAANDLGVSCTGRLHDPFVTIDAMTPGAHESGGHGLKIDYDYAATPCGINFNWRLSFGV